MVLKRVNIKTVYVLIIGASPFWLYY